jgi:hypothetical protein
MRNRETGEREWPLQCENQLVHPVGIDYDCFDLNTPLSIRVDDVVYLIPVYGVQSNLTTWR